MKNIFGIGTALLAATLLGSCGGSSSGLPSGTPEANQAAAVVAVPGLSSTANFSFDLGMVVNGKYYLTDRNNKAVDVVDVTTLQITQIIPTGTLAFAGVSPAGNGKSGPDGINFISSTGQIYVGDVDGVKVVTGNTVTGSIRVGTTGFRADEGCFDPDHNIYMISTPDADTPFASFINAANGTLMATVMSIDTNGSPMGGNEQCQYDHGSQSFLVNNDGTIANPHGEVDVIPVAAIQALARGTTTNVLSIAGLKRFPLGNCDPTGMDLGPGVEMAVMCRPGDAGSPLVTLIMNRNTGAVVATVPFGGGDQLAYDARTNRYYLTGNRWRPSGSGRRMHRDGPVHADPHDRRRCDARNRGDDRDRQQRALGGGGSGHGRDLRAAFVLGRAGGLRNLHRQRLHQSGNRRLLQSELKARHQLRAADRAYRKAAFISVGE